MSSALRSFRNASKFVRNATEFNSAVSGIRNVDAGVPAVTTALRDMPMTLTNNRIRSNNADFAQLQSNFRRGEIRTVFNQAEIPHNITPNQETAFRRTIEVVAPDPTLRQMDMNYRNLLNSHADLDIPINNINDVNNLSPAARAKATSMMTKITRGVKLGGVVVGVVGAAILLEDLLSTAAQAALDRQGCFVTAKVGSRVSSCKISSRSCISKLSTELCGNQVTANLEPNLHIRVFNVLKHHPEYLSALNAAVGTTITESNYQTILNDPAQQIKLFEAFQSLEAFDFTGNECQELNITSQCIACDPSAPIGSVHFVSDEDLPDNQTIVCVTNSTLLETIVDLATGTGTDIFNSVKNTLSGDNLGTWFTWLGIILLVVVFIALSVRFIVPAIQKNKTTKPPTPSAPPLQEPYNPYYRM